MDAFGLFAISTKEEHPELIFSSVAGPIKTTTHNQIEGLKQELGLTEESLRLSMRHESEIMKSRI
jgi:hypothetical protein